MRGAEAVLRISKFLGRKTVVKDRQAKKYRVAELDRALRTQRTKQEARLLHRAKLAGVPCPIILAVDNFSITMTWLPGKRPKKPLFYRTAGRYLANLHSANIIHGDYTPANLLFHHDKVAVIDFGLGFFSTDIEDKAIDVLTMLKAIDSKQQKAFLQGYKKYAKYKQVMKRIEQVKSRVRYA